MVGRAAKKKGRGKGKCGVFIKLFQIKCRAHGIELFFFQKLKKKSFSEDNDTENDHGRAGSSGGGG